MTGLQHVDTFILYVSNRNSRKPKGWTCFALWVLQTPTCLTSVCISASETEKSLGLPIKQILTGETSLLQNFQDPLKQHLGLALFSETQWISCDHKFWKKKTQPNPKLTLYTDSHLYKNTTQEELKKKKIR